MSGKICERRGRTHSKATSLPSGMKSFIRSVMGEFLAWEIENIPLATAQRIYHRGTREESRGPRRRLLESSGRWPGPGNPVGMGDREGWSSGLPIVHFASLWSRLIPSLGLKLIPFWTTNHQPEDLHEAPSSSPSPPQTKSYTRVIISPSTGEAAPRSSEKVLKLQVHLNASRFPRLC